MHAGALLALPNHLLLPTFFPPFSRNSHPWCKYMHASVRHAISPVRTNTPKNKTNRGLTNTSVVQPWLSQRHILDSLSFKTDLRSNTTSVVQFNPTYPTSLTNLATRAQTQHRGASCERRWRGCTSSYGKVLPGDGGVKPVVATSPPPPSRGRA